MSSLELEIIKIFENKLLSIRSALEGDLYEERGRNELLKNIQACIQENRPIQLLLPAFPCKSPNLEKVCGKLPDAAEWYALEHLNRCCQEISSLYEHGCELMIWSDGLVFADLVEVCDEDIATYVRLLKSYSSTMTHIQWDSMDNYIESRNGEDLIEKYGTPTFSFDEWLLKSESNQQQFVHLRKFMQNDGNKKSLSRRELKEKMGLIAKQMITRNEALSNLLKKHYPNYIRLSVHQHVNNGEKFTVCFYKDNIGELHSQSFLRTPWHNVLVIDIQGNFNLMPYRKLNLQNEHIPIMFKDQIWCFVQLPRDAPLLKLSLLAADPPSSGISIDLNNKNDEYQLDITWMKMLLKKFGVDCQNSLDKDNYSQYCRQYGTSLIKNFDSLLSLSTSESNHISHQLLPIQVKISA